MSTHQNGIRILIADDHQMIREGLRLLLEGQPDMTVVGEAGDGRMAVQLAQELAPDVVVMDVTMPDMNGIQATRQIVSHNSSVKVIALSMHSNEQFVMGILKAGALGYVLKESASRELVQGIRTVTKNEEYVSPKIPRSLLAKEPPKGPAVLSKRELEVFKLLVQGKSLREIASIMELSVKTLEKHRQKIMSKLGIHKATELVRYAFVEGII